MDKPAHIHLQAAYKVLKYLKGALGQGLFLSANSDMKITTYSDSYWACCQETKRSLTRFCVFLGESLVSYKSKKQPKMSRSLAKAEYRSMATTVTEILWLITLRKDFKIDIPQLMPLFIDSMSALYILKNLIFYETTKYIEIDYHFLRKKGVLSVIKPGYLYSKKQVTYLFTKTLHPSQFKILLNKLSYNL